MQNLRAKVMSRLAVAALAAAVALPAAAGSSWTQWGGPNRDFMIESGGLASSWPEGGPERIWSRKLGGGYSSVLYEDGRLYTMTLEEDGEAVTAIDAASGETVWTHTYAAKPYESQTTQFGGGPNAAPLIVGNRLFTVGFTSKLHCLNKRDGAVVWSKDLVEEFGGRKLDFGYSSSPIEYEGMVIVLVGGKEHGAIGFDAKDGSVRWKSDPAGISYSSPIVIDMDGQDQLVFMAPTGVVGVDLDSGKVAWRHRHENQYQNNCSGPWWNPETNLLFVASQGDAGGRTLKLTRGEGKTRVRELWSDIKMKVFHNTALQLGDYLYAGSHELIVALDVKTGKTAWRERGFSEANMLMADGKVILLDEEGNLAIATVSPEKLTVLSQHKIVEKPAWTVPTLVGTRLYVRGKGELIALELGAGGAGD